MGRLSGYSPLQNPTVRAAIGNIDNQNPENEDRSSFELALQESQGFFEDIPKYEWEIMRKRVSDVYPNVKGDLEEVRAARTKTNVFFQDHYEPDFACRHERRIGRLGDGGKWVCDPHRLQKRPCLVYSVGSNGDTSFEEAVKMDIGSHCEIHTFDMANYSEVVEAAGANFHQWGISDSAKTTRGGRRQFKTLQETVMELGHVGRAIDIFKIDCEGCEWASYKSFFEAGVQMRQVLIELHSIEFRKETRTSIMPSPEAVNFFEAMYKEGYVIFHKEVNIRFWHFGQCAEFAFLKLHKDFFRDIPALAP